MDSDLLPLPRMSYVEEPEPPPSPTDLLGTVTKVYQFGGKTVLTVERDSFIHEVTLSACIVESSRKLRPILLRVPCSTCGTVFYLRSSVPITCKDHDTGSD